MLSTAQLNNYGPRAKLNSLALELGFDAFGVASVDVPLRRDYYLQWIADGKHGEMSWLERNNERRLDPSEILAEARSIICLGMNYHQPMPERSYRIAQYALGKDYHKVVLKKLKQLCTHMHTTYGSNQKPYVDTGPVLEKPIAAHAGLGWQGKSTILLNRTHGTWLFLGFIITTLDLPADSPAPDRCGSCTRCMTACPTNAITAPYQLDATKCISYWTIEHKGSVPEPMRHHIGDRLFGCDDCLDVCPWNRFASQTRENRFLARNYPTIQEMLLWTEQEFNEAFAGTPIRRSGLDRWKRNCCIVLGNTGTNDDIPLLEELCKTASQLVAEHARWAMAKLKKASARGIVLE